MALRIYYGLDGINIPNPVVTIGTFDGVHLGHQKIIDRLTLESEMINGESVLFTFDPHPRMILSANPLDIKLLQTMDEKMDKLDRSGLKNLIVFPFDKAFSQLSALDFVKEILVIKLKIKKLVIGYDHHFGKNREGNIDFLREASDRFNFEVIEIPAHEIDEANISSTRIRRAIDSGDVQKATRYLGEPFSLHARVVEGQRIGRTIGYPTANLSVINPQKIIPAPGVYAVSCILDGVEIKGMMNIGIRPTVSSDNKVQFEVHLFDFDEEIYGKMIRVQFIARIRDERKFETLQELKNQILCDEKDIRSLFNLPLV